MPPPDPAARPKTLLWWGRSDPNYSRNRVVRCALQQLSWDIIDFTPRVSGLGHLEARLQRIGKPDLVWVPCFRQRDLAAAARAARRWRVPLVFDPLISAYDKQVYERNKFPPDSAGAQKLLAKERGQFARADLVIADTPAHAAYFHDTLGVDADRLAVVPVGAEAGLFEPTPLTPIVGRPIEVLFYGSFIALQGPELIVEAARRCPSARWALLGDGPLRAACEHAAGQADHIRFEAPVGYDQLSVRIARADVLLGVFSPSAKAGRVVPNKVYQALACGRPVVTRRSDAYPAGLADQPATESGLAWVEPGNSAALSRAIEQLAGETEVLGQMATAARSTYEKHMSADTIRDAIAAALSHLDTPSDT
ncbi:MAG: glycosyltransferase [Planctomycetota bacterium]